MKFRVSARDKTTGDMREAEAEGADYQAVKAGLPETLPDVLQEVMINAERPETFAQRCRHDAGRR